MALDWITAFQDDLLPLHLSLRACVRDEMVLSRLRPGEHHMLRYVASEVGAIFLWARSLPLNEEVWACVDARVLGDDILRILSNLGAWLNNQALKWSNTDEMPPPIMDEALNAFSHATRAFYEVPRRYERLDGNQPLYRLAPDVVLDALWIHTATRRMLFSIRTRSLPEGRRILYHPYYTLYALLRLIRRLNRERLVNSRLILTMRGTPHFLDLIVTSPTLRLTPTLWQSILNDISAPDRGRWLDVRSADEDMVEILRELGGDITPFFWNLGYGEGIVVRLPWVE
jgi:hypothetical protein